ncbi:MAG: glycoside hydrolase family 127 protein, partial [Ginsengibacter sp.]
GYIYAQKNDQLFVNLFISSNVSLKIQNKEVDIIQQNNYPWDGDLKFTVNPKSSLYFSMLVRIPGWAQNEAIPSDLYTFKNNSDSKVAITVNGKTVDHTIENGYAVLNRTWKKNDVIEVKLPMEVRRVIANRNVKNDIGKIALQRGPVMYCAEWVDNNGKTSNIVMPAETNFTTEYKPDLLNGIEILKAKVPVVLIDANGENLHTETQSFTAIPYYAWANRGKGEMMIWLPEKVKDIDLVSNE